VDTTTRFGMLLAKCSRRVKTNPKQIREKALDEPAALSE